MNQNYFKVNSMARTKESKNLSKNQHHQQKRERKKDQEEKTFIVEERQEDHPVKTTSTLWGIYSMLMQGEVKREELTGTTFHDLLTILMPDKTIDNSSLMDQYHSLQNTQKIERCSDESLQRKRTDQDKRMSF